MGAMPPHAPGRLQRAARRRRSSSAHASTQTPIDMPCFQGGRRAYGGAPFSRHASTIMMGLSPRVRGSRLIPRLARDERGPIPAGAGKPPPARSANRLGRVYPRGCGEAWIITCRILTFSGLSPRVQGSLDQRVGVPKIDGSIPAGAGKPKAGPLRVEGGWVYPRGCGEAACRPCRCEGARGLSPRVRGSQGPLARLHPPEGSIPAGAGKPVAGQASREAGQVYPRGCGEAFAFGAEPVPFEGLSPRVRGSRDQLATGARLRGSIPAGAGKPGGSPSPAALWRVYPRGCGEATFPMRFGFVRGGLSPRVRGSLGAFEVDRKTLRSIPAGAGKPRTPP